MKKEPAYCDYVCMRMCVHVGVYGCVYTHVHVKHWVCTNQYLVGCLNSNQVTIVSCCQKKTTTTKHWTKIWCNWSPNLPSLFFLDSKPVTCGGHMEYNKDITVQFRDNDLVTQISGYDLFTGKAATMGTWWSRMQLFQVDLRWSSLRGQLYLEPCEDTPSSRLEVPGVWVSHLCPVHNPCLWWVDGLLALHEETDRPSARATGLCSSHSMAIIPRWYTK